MLLCKFVSQEKMVLKTIKLRSSSSSFHWKKEDFGWKNMPIIVSFPMITKRSYLRFDFKSIGLNSFSNFWDTCWKKITKHGWLGALTIGLHQFHSSDLGSSYVTTY